MLSPEQSFGYDLRSLGLSMAGWVMSLKMFTSSPLGTGQLGGP